MKWLVSAIWCDAMVIPCYVTDEWSANVNIVVWWPVNQFVFTDRARLIEVPQTDAHRCTVNTWGEDAEFDSFLAS